MTRSRGARFRPVCRVAIFTLILFLLPVSLLAQDETGDATSTPAEDVLGTASPANVGDRGAEVLGQLEGTTAEARRYQERLLSASAEDSLVLRLQIGATHDRFMDILGELAQVAVETKDLPAYRELRERTVDVYGAVTPRIWELIGELRRSIDLVRAHRTETPPSERSALEDELGHLTDHLDRYVSYSRDHLKNMASFGLDTTGEKGIFGSLLEERADELSGRISLGLQRIQELGQRLRETPGDADLTALQIAAQKSLQINTKSQATTLDAMDDLGLRTDLYRAELVAATQDLASGLLDAKVAVTLMRQGWNAVRTWLEVKGPSFAVKVILFLVIIIAGWFLARLVGKGVEKSLQKAKFNMSHLLKRMTVTFTKNAIIVMALVFGLAQLGFSLGPLLAGFGVIGFILGFAMQDSLSNLAAGMMILINRPYDVGDLVEISGVFGKVEHMSMVSTSILTLDNQKLVVPNSKIWGDVIKNVTDQRMRRVDMTFGISYTDDIPHAEKVLIEILEKSDQVLKHPEPMVRLHTLNDSSVDFVVRPWVKTDDYWDVYWEVTRAVKMRFDEEEISIPFPQRDVHMYEEKKFPKE